MTVEGSLSELGANFNEALASVKSEVKDLSVALVKLGDLSMFNSNNIVRHLDSCGLIDSGSRVDVPKILWSVHSLLDKDIAPIFKAGLVSQIGPDDSGVEDVTSPANPTAAGSSMAANINNNVIGDCMTRAGVSGASVAAPSAYPTQSAAALMPPPADFHQLQRSYLPVQSPQYGAPVPSPSSNSLPAFPSLSTGNSQAPDPALMRAQFGSSDFGRANVSSHHQNWPATTWGMTQSYQSWPGTASTSWPNASPAPSSSGRYVPPSSVGFVTPRQLNTDN